jgi:hypothetical protein
MLTSVSRGGVFIADRQQVTGHPFGTIRAGHGNFVGRQRHTVIPPAAEVGPILVPIAYGDTETNSPPQYVVSAGHLFLDLVA